MRSIIDLHSMVDRNVLVTGAAGRLGSIISSTLAELGANLILVDRDQLKLQEIVNKATQFKDVSITMLQCDLEIEAERDALCQRVYSEHQHLSCLVNCAAFVGDTALSGWSQPFEAQTLEPWRRAIEVNLTAVFHLSQMLLPALKNGVSPSIVNITSIYGQYGPDWRLYECGTLGNPAAYAASKGGLVQLTRWLATTLAPTVRVNAVSPGGVYSNQSDSFVAQYESRVPLARMAREDDLQGAIAFLASDASKYVTGQIISIDGGWGIW